MLISSRSYITVAVIVTLLVVQAMVHLALSAPRLDVAFKPGAAPAATGLVIASVREDGPNAGRLREGDEVIAFLAAGREIPADASLLIEEPDTLLDYQTYNNFMQQQSALFTALNGDGLAIRLANGTQVELATRASTLRDLPFLFWFQLFVGAAGVLTAAIVLALGKRSLATTLYALTGLGYLIFAPAAAVYSTRELALSGELIRALSIANHFGALFFTASLTALMWVYPKLLGRHFVVFASYFAALCCWLLDTFQVMETPMLFHLGVLGIFSVSLIFSGAQWLRTRGSPADRAALRWFLLSIYLATGLFSGTIIVPAAFNLPMPASQGVMFGAFLIMYWGLALGVARYRLFRLEEWWYAIWAWFLSGVAVLLLDFMLIGFLGMTGSMALALSVAVVGWLYFPVRQWLWEGLGHSPRRRMQDWLPAALPVLIQRPEGDGSERELAARWPALLTTVFSPLSTETGSHSANKTPQILEEGLALRVPPALDGDAPILLRHADGGRRLFTRRDIDTLNALRGLFDLSRDSLRAHELGASTERSRIARDIHDDLGAKLLGLLYRSREEDQHYVRDAIACTRELVGTLSLAPVALPVAIARWREDLRERLDSAAVSLDFSVEGSADGISLSARQYANLTRILREAATNALKHAGAHTIKVRIRVTDCVEITLNDDGCGMAIDAADKSGRGMEIMKARAAELGGEVHWQTAAGTGCAVTIAMPLSPGSSTLASASDKTRELPT